MAINQELYDFSPKMYLMKKFKLRAGKKKFHVNYGNIVNSTKAELTNE